MNIIIINILKYSHCLVSKKNILIVFWFPKVFSTYNYGVD